MANSSYGTVNELHSVSHILGKISNKGLVQYRNLCIKRRTESLVEQFVVDSSPVVEVAAVDSSPVVEVAAVDSSPVAVVAAVVDSSPVAVVAAVVDSSPVAGEVVAVDSSLVAECYPLMVAAGFAEQEVFEQAQLGEVKIGFFQQQVKI